MKKIENNCVGCPPEIGCLGSACPYVNIEVYYCDDCGDETTLYYFEDMELCINCIIKRLDCVDGSSNGDYC